MGWDLKQNKTQESKTFSINRTNKTFGHHRNLSTVPDWHSFLGELLFATSVTAIQLTNRNAHLN